MPEALTRQVVDTLAPLARDKGMALSIETAEAIAPGDRDELIRLVENLVENAIKYGADAPPERRRVETRVERHGDQIAVSVRDFGPGVAPEHAPRLTERFYRVDVGRAARKAARGLASPSSNTFSRAIADASRSTAALVRARRFALGCRR